MSTSVTRKPVEVDALGHQIARRARDVGDDRAAAPSERVEQARLADVRRADDRDLQPFANQPAAPRRRRAARRSARTSASIARATAPGSTK